MNISFNQNTTELEKKLKIDINTCIHCSTLELAKQVLGILHKLNLKWCNGKYYILCTNWDTYKENTVYHPFEGRFSSLEYTREINCKIINAEKFIGLHFDLENYTPKGQLEGFPKEIIALMLEYQVEQGNKRNISAFEKDRTAGEIEKGFVWRGTKEDYNFWNEVIRYKNFDLFFEKYPKKEETKICSKCHKEKSLSEFHKRKDTVYPEYEECRKQEYQVFITLHIEDEEFDLENYEPKGQLEGFPKEIISRMLECQVEQGNKRDVSVFERNIYAALDQGGFDWDTTIEKGIFWSEVISANNLKLFFKKYQKKDNQQDNSQEFKVGDKVYDILLKEIGIVQDIIYSSSIPYGLLVEFKSGVKSYTINGCYIPEYKNPHLLHYKEDYNYKS